jgi:hypothetical protein
MAVEPSPYPPASSPVERMDHHERARARTAAFHATRIYPGPVGEVLSRELLTWEEMGWRLDRTKTIARLIEHLLKVERGEETAVTPGAGKGCAA